MSTLFVSHASDDAETVQAIVGYLERNNVACWISSRDIPPSAIYAEAITQGVRDAAACAVIVSRSANESDAMKRELELASHFKKRFIPIRIDATEPGPGLDYYLRNTQWIDYRRERENALDRIVTHLKGAPGPATATTSSAPRPAQPYTPPAYTPPSYTPPGSSHAAYTPAETAKTGGGPPIAWLIAGAVVVLALGAWFISSQMSPKPTQTAEITQPAPVETAPAETAPAPRATDSDSARAAEAERLRRERDQAINDARDAQARLDAERRQREADAARARVTTPDTSTSLSGSTWFGSWDWDGYPTIGWSLRSDHTACYGYSQGDYSNCNYNWSQTGNRLVLTNPQQTWTGVVNGRVYSGSVSGVAEGSTFYLRRQ